MKDYDLLMYLAKLTGAKPKKSKHSLYCFFPYSDDAVMTTFFTFKNKKSTAVYFDLLEIFEEHVTEYGTYEDFVEAFCQKYDFFEPAQIGDDWYVYSDLSVNKLDRDFVPALTNITVMVGCLNEFLGRDEDNYSEEEWRNLYRSMTAQKKKHSLFGIIGSVAAAVVGSVLLNLAEGTGFLGLLGFLLVPAGVIAAIYFIIRYRYFNSKL